MKILFVVGGSYKAFYLNKLKQYKDVDLLIFQHDIIYQFDYCDECFGESVITKELISLANRLNCIIISPVQTKMFGYINRELLVCAHNKVYLLDYNRYVSILIDNCHLKIATNLSIYNTDVAISVIDNTSKNKRLTYNKLAYKNNQFRHTTDLIRKSNVKRRFICDKKCVLSIKNSKITRKFRKICYFCLKL